MKNQLILYKYKKIYIKTMRLTKGISLSKNDIEIIYRVIFILNSFSNKYLLLNYSLYNTSELSIF